MKALTYQGARDVRVETLPDPVRHAPDDLILRVTATAICGSDLHIYRGKIPEQILMVDHHPYRLDFAAATYGVVPIHFERIEDPAAYIIEATGHHGVDATIDAVGFEAKGSTTETVLTTLRLEGSSGAVLRQAIAATRRGGVVSVPGVYAGFIHGFLFGDAFEKGLTFRSGQTHAQRYMPELLERISAGQLRPEQIVTHELPLLDAARGYEIFNEKQEDCRKIILRPGLASTAVTESAASPAAGG